MRYFIELSYCGTNYRGWQFQRNAQSVQGKLNECLSIRLGMKIETTGSGRTDAGVHAIQQFIHFDFDKTIDPDILKFQLNQFLPQDISVQKIFKVRHEAHARFDAIEREYRYIITTEKDPFYQNMAYYFNTKLDISLMNKVAYQILDWKDFQSFSKVKTDVNHFECSINHAQWSTEDHRLIFVIAADRFLRGMVRAIVGTMLEIGQGRMKLDELKKILRSKDRRKAGRAVPAHGLYLSRVSYPEDMFNNGD
ncbi:tRNA pseudouridine(38-40) synthase TruA [Bacteroidota bacterium]